MIADLRRALVTPDEKFCAGVGSVHGYIPDGDHRSAGAGADPFRFRPQESAGTQQNRNSRYGNEPVRERQPEHRSSRNTGTAGGPSGRTKRREPDEEINPGIEKLLTAAGIVVAVLIVIVLIFLVTRLGGLFRSGTPKETERHCGDYDTGGERLVG